MISSSVFMNDKIKLPVAEFEGFKKCQHKWNDSEHWSIGPLVHWSIGPLVNWSIGWMSNVMCHMSYFKCQMSKIKCQMSIRFNFCRSVPPEFLQSFLTQIQQLPMFLEIICFKVYFSKVYFWKCISGMFFCCNNVLGNYIFWKQIFGKSIFEKNLLKMYFFLKFSSWLMAS